MSETWTWGVRGSHPLPLEKPRPSHPTPLHPTPPPPQISTWSLVICKLLPNFNQFLSNFRSKIAHTSKSFRPATFYPVYFRLSPISATLAWQFGEAALNADVESARLVAVARSGRARRMAADRKDSVRPEPRDRSWLRRHRRLQVRIFITAVVF